MNQALKIRLNRVVRRTLAAPRLRQRGGARVPPRRRGEVWLFLIVRNEELRLPHVLEYHFARGVSHVVALDNQSTDRTVDILEADSRISLFTTTQSFKGNKIAWLEILLRRYGVGEWNLVLDADELFAYPHMDRLSIPDLAAYFNQRKREAMHALFLEMFSRETMASLHYQPGAALLDAAPWFDAATYTPVPYQAVFRKQAPSCIYMGGTRARVFSGEFGCSKYPFFTYRPGQFLRLGLHTMEGAEIAEEQGAVLHFKYLQDFREKALREARRGLYWNASAEYKAYAEEFEREGDFSLWHAGAQQWKGPQQLIQLGLMKSSASLDAYAASISPSRSCSAV
ncbi:MAG: glycosyltransferase family 2 protein [Verrucomicrobiota bacterium]|jgi:glycosyltransferase involved in cell wall biosynthesis|nr:glycosyltransferase family 2 protein [Verrucomicrobiota bacterium]